MTRTRALLFLILILGVTVCIAQEAIPLDHGGRPQWEIRQWTDFPVRLELRDQAALAELLQTVPIVDFSREQIQPVPGRSRLRLETRVSAREFAALEAAGYAPLRIRDVVRENREAMERSWADAVGDKSADKAITPLTSYPTHAQIGTMLADIATNYPTLSRTFQWGTSVQGRELWGLVLSSDVTVDGVEPEVRLSSTIHGDEPLGIVLLLDLAMYLTENYGQTGYEDVTWLMDNYELHLMPLHNPDGYVLGRRANANYVDLNRNFQEPAGTQPYLDVENIAFIGYMADKHFVVSGNLHGGALVVNYPWDYTYVRAPDDDALIVLSLEYSIWNTPMYTGVFPLGITNGADWYVATGTLQDWSYDQTDCIDVTLELSNTKTPGTGTLAGYWDDNRESFMHYIKAARYGVNGVVTCATSGAPLDAEVTVVGNSKSVHTDPDNGDYYKLLDTGIYELQFSAAGYQTLTVSNVATTWGTPTVLDVALDSIPSDTPPPAFVTRLVGAAPNPFNPTVRIDFEVAGSGPVELDIFDAAGRRVRCLMAEDRTPGPAYRFWDGRGDGGADLPSGLYLVRFRAGPTVETLKLTLVR